MTEKIKINNIRKYKHLAIYDNTFTEFDNLKWYLREKSQDSLIKTLMDFWKSKNPTNIEERN